MPPILARDLVPGPAPHQLSLVTQSRDAAVPAAIELDGLSPDKQSRGAAVHEAIELDGTHRALAARFLLNILSSPLNLLGLSALDRVAALRFRTNRANQLWQPQGWTAFPRPRARATLLRS